MEGNPPNWTDPSGRCVDPLSFWLCAAIGGTIIGGVTGAAYNVMVHQGVGLGGANQGNFSAVDWDQTGRVGAFGAGLGAVTALAAPSAIGNISAVAGVAATQGIGSLAFTQAAHAAMWNIGGTAVLSNLAYRGLTDLAITGQADVGQLLREESQNPLLGMMFLADMAFSAYESFQALGGWTALRARGQGKTPSEREYIPSGDTITIRGEPGAAGVQVPRRLTVEEMNELTQRTGLEYMLTYRPGPGRNGGGGQYWLYSGTENSVSMPRQEYAIYHTHPAGSAVPSGIHGDIGALRYRQAFGNLQRSTQIIPLNKPPVRYWINGDYTSGNGFRNVFSGEYFERR